MCLIIDANMMGLFLKMEDSDLQPVRKWMESGSGRLAYSEFGQIFEEFETHEGMTRKVRDYFARGKLKSVPPEKIEMQIKVLQNLDLSSNDAHIIALALESGAKVLVSRDQLLGKDFQNLTNGSIYKRREHQHLLRNYRCP